MLTWLLWMLGESEGKGAGQPYQVAGRGWLGGLRLLSSSWGEEVNARDGESSRAVGPASTVLPRLSSSSWVPACVAPRAGLARTLPTPVTSGDPMFV